MKLGLDFYHLRGPNQEKILKLALDTFKRGGKVFIVGDEPAPDLRHEVIHLMALHRITKPFWSNMYCTVDYMIHNNIPNYKLPDGTIKALRKKDWDSLRGGISNETGFDLFIGYDPDHEKYFEPGVFCLMK